MCTLRMTTYNNLNPCLEDYFRAYLSRRLLPLAKRYHLSDNTREHKHTRTRIVILINLSLQARRYLYCKETAIRQMRFCIIKVLIFFFIEFNNTEMHFRNSFNFHHIKYLYCTINTYITQYIIIFFWIYYVFYFVM